MKAVRVHTYGGPEVAVCEAIECPQPSANQIRIRVRASGVGPWDAWIRAGRSVLPQPLPLTLGSDCSGVVDAIGASITEFAVGDEVFGVPNERFTEAHAEFALASPYRLARKPSSLGWIEAAGLPVVAVTAWQALFEGVPVGRGARVLIHGASGSVGECAVQMARAAGAEVWATASSSEVSFVQARGASTVIDARATRFEEGVGNLDFVLDTIGGDVLARSPAVLRRGGRLVSIVAPPDASEAQRRGIDASFLLVDVTSERLSRVAAQVEAGALKLRIGSVFGLCEARQAHEMLDGIRARPRGKIVLSHEDAGG